MNRFLFIGFFFTFFNAFLPQQLLADHLQNSLDILDIEEVSRGTPGNNSNSTPPVKATEFKKTNLSYSEMKKAENTLITLMTLRLSGAMLPEAVLRAALNDYEKKMEIWAKNLGAPLPQKPVSKPPQKPKPQNSPSKPTPPKEKTAHGVVEGSVAYVKVASTLNFRTGPWGRIQGSFTSGTPIKVLDIKGDWVKVSHKGKIGFVHADYLRPKKPSNAPPPSNPGQVANGNNGKFGGRPLKGGRVSSEYGYRIHPITGARKLHTGTDIAAPRGTPVYALGTGRVVSASWGGGYGKLVKIKYDNGYEAYYAHLDDYAGMTPGKRVSPGMVVGKVDSTGSSTGHHLHFEIRKNGVPMNARNCPGVHI